ncbi:helix-turn-helix domain-containing protein [Thalassotalea euphylliae]|uniref:XRE family transcriptional regulator n=1 Tax=Thalassotalea euphylliae TaxID=1655234 RepID=A0A3E0UH90_9GAMM|nr:helix-turn-helix transcriptional regulator [Thalassotalea euphylliae]REL36249.1 XRE family transcriptional regulator [Thalassotalea euphylliae]
MLLSTDKLKKIRSEHGWSQEVLAKASGLSVRTIQRIESDGKASAESTLAIASVFNLSPQLLMATSNEIEVNWVRRIIMKNLMALLVITGAIAMFVVLGESASLVIDVQSGLFLILFLYAATVIAFGTKGMLKSIQGLKYLFTDELVGGVQAQYLAKLYSSQVKFLYAGALIGFISGAIGILGNIDTYENFVFQRASSFNLIIIFHAAIIAESIFRPLSLKLKTCDMLS